jgi:hypothetical protein
MNIIVSQSPMHEGEFNPLLSAEHLDAPIPPQDHTSHGRGYWSSFLHSGTQIFPRSHINIFLICVPLGISSQFLQWKPLYVFLLNLFALLPLGRLVSVVVSSMSSHLGHCGGGIFKATFGNTVMVVVSCEIE